MKKLISIILLLLLFSAGSIISEPKNPVLEYCTGTWCPTCPCAHRLIRDSILIQHPGTIVISYHGQPTSSDPFRNFNGNNILSMMGFVNYASGVVNRTSSPKARTFWVNDVNNLSSDTASVNISVVKDFNPSSGLLTAGINLKALGNLTGSYFVNYILAEDSLITTQNGNSSCIGGSNYRLDQVVRDMINGAEGELITDVPWNSQQVIVKNLSYTLTPGWNPYNSYLIVMVYKDYGGNFNHNTIQQAVKLRVSETPLSVNNTNSNEYGYFLNQNYPNPFNPVTTISYNLPKSGIVNLKLYNINGKEVKSLLNEFKQKGYYEFTFDGAELSSGIYFYTITAGEFIRTNKMTLLK